MLYCAAISYQVSNISYQVSNIKTCLVDRDDLPHPDGSAVYIKASLVIITLSNGFSLGVCGRLFRFIKIIHKEEKQK